MTKRGRLYRDRSQDSLNLQDANQQKEEQIPIDQKPEPSENTKIYHHYAAGEKMDGKEMNPEVTDDIQPRNERRNSSIF